MIVARPFSLAHFYVTVHRSFLMHVTTLKKHNSYWMWRRPAAEFWTVWARPSAKARHSLSCGRGRKPKLAQCVRSRADRTGGEGLTLFGHGRKSLLLSYIRLGTDVYDKDSGEYDPFLPKINSSLLTGQKLWFMWYIIKAGGRKRWIYSSFIILERWRK